MNRFSPMDQENLTKAVESAQMLEQDLRRLAQGSDPILNEAISGLIGEAVRLEQQLSRYALLVGAMDDRQTDDLMANQTTTAKAPGP